MISRNMCCNLHFEQVKDVKDGLSSCLGSSLMILHNMGPLKSLLYLDFCKISDTENSRHDYDMIPLDLT